MSNRTVAACAFALSVGCASADAADISSAHRIEPRPASPGLAFGYVSDMPDALIGQVDLIRIRSDVSLRYDPSSRQLVLHVDPPAGGATAAQ